MNNKVSIYHNSCAILLVKKRKKKGIKKKHGQKDYDHECWLDFFHFHESFKQPTDTPSPLYLASIFNKPNFF